MKVFLSLLMGFYSGWVLNGTAARLLGTADCELPLPAIFNGLVFFSLAAGSAWLILHRASTVQRVIFNGCALGAIEWLTRIPATKVFAHRVPSLVAEPGMTAATVKRQVEAARTLHINDNMGAVVALMICVAGLLLTKNSLRQPEPGAVSSPRRPPNPTLIKSVVLAELILLGLVVALIVWCVVGDLELMTLLVLFLALLVGIPLIPLSIVGLVQGVRLLRARTNRTLGIVAVVISCVPASCALLGVARAPFMTRKLPPVDTALLERYKSMQAVFACPKQLENAHCNADNDVVLTFPGNIDVTVSIGSSGEPLAAFCREHLLGQEMVVTVPNEDHFVYYKGEASSNCGWTVTYRGSSLDDYRARTVQDELERSSDNGRSEIAHISPLVAGSRLPTVNFDAEERRWRLGETIVACPTSGATADEKERWQELKANECARVAEQLCLIADADHSGFVSGREGEKVWYLIRYGYVAAYLIEHEKMDLDGVGRGTGKSASETEMKIREYNDLCRRAQEAGITSLPVIAMPPQAGDVPVP